MAATWDEFLQEASLDGIAFDMVGVRTEGGRDLDRREYPLVDGAEVVDLARNGLSLQVHAIFEGDAYPERYQKFIEALNAGGHHELVHPVHGRITVAVEHWVDSIDSEDAVDFGSVEVTFVEHTDQALGPFQGSDAASLANLVRSACDDLDVASAKLDAYVASLEDPPAALVEASAAAPTVSAQFAASATTLEEDGDQLSQSAIAANVNGALNLSSSLLARLGDYATPEVHAVSQAAIAAGARLERLAAQLLAERPPLVSIRIEADVPLLQWAHDRYGTSARAEEVLRLNSLPDPLMLHAGQTLVAYAS